MVVLIWQNNHVPQLLLFHLPLDIRALYAFTDQHESYARLVTQYGGGFEELVEVLGQSYIARIPDHKIIMNAVLP